MSRLKPDKVKVRFYEYPFYWLVTAVLLILAIPVVIFKFAGYLIGSTGAPMKSVKHFVGFLLVIIIVAISFIAYKIFIPYDIGTKTRSIMIGDKDRFSTILNNMNEAGILKDDYLFKLMAISTGLDKSLSPGRYDFSGRISQYDVLRKLRNRDIATLLVTIPEGFSVSKTADLMARRLNINSTGFIARALDSSFTKSEYGIEGLEGYLFPETYRFWYGIKIDQIIDIMLSEFKERTQKAFDSRQVNLSEKDIVILASIIESEAGIEEEKRTISSVYHNRLKKKMRLQADPTVIYALGGLDRPLYYRDLEYDSPYNTYKYKGLPPGPINSPGLSSIIAAINPEETDYLYFVADGTGRHIFSRTLKEHNRAKNKIKKAKKRVSRK